MEKTKYKYKINECYEAMPRSIAIAPLLKKNGIRQSTFYQDKSILVTEDRDIPAGRLLKYATIFNVSIEQLFNYNGTAKVSSVGKKVVASAKLSKA